MLYVAKYYSASFLRGGARWEGTDEISAARNYVTYFDQIQAKIEIYDPVIQCDRDQRTERCVTLLFIALSKSTSINVAQWKKITIITVAIWLTEEGCQLACRKLQLQP